MNQRKVFMSNNNSFGRDRGSRSHNRRSGGGRSHNNNSNNGSNNSNNNRGKQPNRTKHNRKTINPNLFVNRAVAKADEVVYVPQHAFKDFGFSEKLYNNLTRLGFTTPTPIQDQAIPVAMSGGDLLGLANTGTGKTGAFLLPIINKLTRQASAHSVLIVAPTRELAQQIDTEFREFASNMGIYSVLLVGGANIDRQMRDLKRNPQILIGTPGRLGDLVKRGALSLAHVEVFVLDEVDRMLDMGFVNDIKRLASQITSPHQTLCFSATMTMPIQGLLSGYMKSGYQTVSVKQTESNEHIEQGIIHATDKNHKIEILGNLLTKDEFDRVLIFGATKHGVQRLADNLTKNGIPSIAIHGNKSQPQRARALKDFKDGKYKVLVATDVAARGLNIPDVSHVINFDQPQTYEDYIHRIGRTGRAGKSGNSLTFVD
jgi:superfamily II DNA/RNA helicase